MMLILALNSISLEPVFKRPKSDADNNTEVELRTSQDMITDNDIERASAMSQPFPNFKVSASFYINCWFFSVLESAAVPNFKIFFPVFVYNIFVLICIELMLIRFHLLNLAVSRKPSSVH